MNPMRAIFTLLILLAVARTGASNANEATLPLKVEYGQYSSRRDSRVFAVPIKCNGTPSHFTWGCGGWTIVSESFARRLNLVIKPDRQTNHLLDAAGQPVFVGQTQFDLALADRESAVIAKVMRDTEQNKGMNGVIGFDIARRFQWELDPSVPSLTLRGLGGKPSRPPIAVLPLSEQDDQLWIALKHKGKPAELLLAPQNSDTQAGPGVQKAWDLSARGKDNEAFVRSIVLEKSTIDFTDNIREADAVVVLMGHPEKNDPAEIPSSIGQSLLNRFVYCVDLELKQLMLLEKAKPPKK